MGKADISTASKSWSSLAALPLSLCANTLQSQGRAGAARTKLSKSRLSGRFCSDIPTRAGKQQPCRAVGAPTDTFSVWFFFFVLPDICLPLGLQEIEASMHSSCSCSHNSDYLCTASRARSHQWLGGEQERCSQSTAAASALCHTLSLHPGLGTLSELPQTEAPGKSLTAVKQQVLVYSLLAVVQFTPSVNEI